MTALYDRLKNLFANHKMDVLIIFGGGFVTGMFWATIVGWVL